MREREQVTRSDFFFCYIEDLTQKLLDANCKYIAVGLNPNNLNKFFMFQQTDQVKKIVGEYMQNRGW